MCVCVCVCACVCDGVMNTGVKVVRQMDPSSPPVEGDVSWSWLSGQLFSLSLFSLRLLQWWYSGERETAFRKMTCLPIPPPPHHHQVREGGRETERERGGGGRGERERKEGRPLSCCDLHIISSLSPAAKFREYSFTLFPLCLPSLSSTQERPHCTEHLGVYSTV